jgi:hypothetical protein
MAKKPERGEKARWIREALVANPDLGPTELAEMLNKKAADAEVKLTFKPVEISAAKSREAKKQQDGGGGGRKGRTRAAAGSAAASTAATAAGAGEAVVKLMEAAKALGKEEAKKILDLMG